jgi:hypothetical protein
MIERNYWRHAGTGEIWAVETHAGAPVRCSGPLSPSDVHPLLLDHLLYTYRYIPDLRANWPSCSLVRLCALCSLALLPGAATVSHNGDAAVHMSCSLNPPSVGAQPVGAAVFAEALWQTSARLRREGAALRQHSDGLIRRCAIVRAKHAPGEIAVAR